MVDKNVRNCNIIYKVKENRGNFGEKSDKCSLFVHNDQKKGKV